MTSVDKSRRPDESRLLRLAAELLEKHLDADRITLTGVLPPDRDAGEIRKNLSGKEMEEFLELWKERGDIACIIAADMGCGNCSMAVGTPGSLSDLIELIPLDTGDRDKAGKPIKAGSIQTIIGYDTPDSYQIGSQALFAARKARQNFKERPQPSYREGVSDSLQRVALEYEDANGEVQRHTLEKVWGDFLKKMIEKGLEGLKGTKWTTGGPIDRDKVLLVVAHPSDELWGRADVLDLYRAMISKHTQIPRRRILTFSEARAAMQFFRGRGGLDFSRGVLIIDLGASTIDVEYLSSQTRDPMEYSLTMAGRDVDRILAHDILSQEFGDALTGLAQDELPDDAFFARHQEALGTRQQFEYFARKTKEGISNEARNGVPDHEKREYINSADRRQRRAEYGYSVGDLKRLLANIPVEADYAPDIAAYHHSAVGVQSQATAISQSWYRHLATLLRFVLDRLRDGDLGLGYVLVTGGSSNLPGIEEQIGEAMAQSGFRKQDTVVRMFTNYSDYESCVPVGSCRYVERVWSNLDRMATFEEILPQTVRQDLVKHHEDIDRIISDAVIGKFQEGLNEWAGIRIGNHALFPSMNDRDPRASFNGLMEIVQGKIKGMALNGEQGLIQQGVRAMRARADEVMESTLQAANELLTQMANSSYSAAIPINMDGITLRTRTIRAYLDGFIEQNRGSLYATYTGILEYLFHKKIEADSPVRDGVRGRIAGNFLDPDTQSGKEVRESIRSGISKKVGNAIAGAYDKNAGFGIADGILDGMVDHIKTALYLVNTKDTKK